MPTEIELLRQDKKLVVAQGYTTPHFNLKTTKASVEEIERGRAEPIDKATFMACMTLVAQRYDRIPNKDLMLYYYAVMQPRMGRLEFLAAFSDLMFAKTYYADIWNFLTSHVQSQREEGPDLFGKKIAEGYQSEK